SRWVRPTRSPVARPSGSGSALAGETRVTASAVEPGGHEPPAVVVAEIRPEVPDVPLPRRDRDRRGAVQVIDLLGEVTLDVPEDRPPPADVEGPALEPDHVGEPRVVHPAGVGGLAGQVIAGQVAVGIGPRTEEPGSHPLELAVDRACEVRAVLLELQFGLDPDRLELAEADLDRVDPVGAVAGRGLERGLEAAAVPGLRQQ